jgi:hypothetical protein
MNLRAFLGAAVRVSIKRGIPAKLSVAMVAAIALVDLQVYLDRHYRRSDMFGTYLRRQVKDDACGRVASSRLNTCPEETLGTGRKAPPTKSFSDGVLRS